MNIINVGRYTDQKDQLTLLKAINLIKDQVDIKLLIVGRGIKKNDLISYINLNNLKNNVQLVNFTKNPFNLIRSSDLFILTSLYEGLPNVLLEALTLKKFIISTDCPTGPKEILLNGKAGNLFKPGDYKQLSKLIINYKNNKVKELTKVKFGYKNLDRFDFDKNLKKYFLLIDKFLY